MIPCCREGALHFVARQRIQVVDGGLAEHRLRWASATTPTAKAREMRHIDALLDRRLELMKERDAFEKPQEEQPVKTARTNEDQDPEVEQCVCQCGGEGDSGACPCQCCRGPCPMGQGDLQEGEGRDE